MTETRRNWKMFSHLYWRSRGDDRPKEWSYRSDKVRQSEDFGNSLELRQVLACKHTEPDLHSV